MRTNLMYSELFYLFSDKEVDKAGIIGLNDTHPTGKKLKTIPLAEKMVLLALFYLSKNEYITFTLKTKRKFFFFVKKKLLLTKIKENKGELSGIEEKLLNNIATDTSLHKAVLYILNTDLFDPWGEIVRVAKESLVKKGYLISETKKKFIFIKFIYKFLAKPLDTAKEDFSEMKNNWPMFEKQSYYKLLHKVTIDAIKSRQESPNTNND